MARFRVMIGDKSINFFISKIRRIVSTLWCCSKDCTKFLKQCLHTQEAFKTNCYFYSHYYFTSSEDTRIGTRPEGGLDQELEYLGYNHRCAAGRLCDHMTLEKS